MYPLTSSSPRHQHGRGNANVKVVVRLRPLNEAEHSEKYHTVTEAISDHMLVFDPKVQNAPGFLPTNQRDINRRRFKDLKYVFDFVFGPVASNKDVFEHTTKGIVSGVLNGYNCSVFAYGATGAGKTHTMLGNEREPGVIYYTMIDLYKRINEQKDEKMFDVAVSYSEVYNEQVRDLLMPRGSLPIREDKTVGVIIAGLSLHKPKNADELLHMLHFGNKNRTQHPTDANAESSRSHAVFQVFVNQREKSANVSTEVKMAKMCLVDLAGSERANHTTNRGARFREGANINRSLLALGNVINALADNKFKGHIPYRDSKLTRLLKDSLGGNCQTVMIAAVSPSSRSFEDTYNTLRYADRAKHITADLKKNVVSVDFHIANYKKYVQELEKENQELRKAKQKLMESLDRGNPVAAPMVSPIIRQFQERLKDLFKTRKDIRKGQMESEGAKRELRWKVARKEQAIKRVQQLTGSPSVIGKHRRVIERMQRRIAKEEQALKDSSHRIHEQDNAIHNTYSEISSTLNNGKQFAELLDSNIRIHTVEANLFDSHMYLAFVKKMARAQERQSLVNESLINCLIQLVKKQHDILHSQDLLNNELKAKYEQCCYLVEERGVAWVNPAAPQEGTPTSKQAEEDEELCISEIIDIQMPKLHVQTIRTDSTPSKTKAEILPLIQQQPQRVVKPMSAVKPATRVATNQIQHHLNSGDKGSLETSSSNSPLGPTQPGQTESMYKRGEPQNMSEAPSMNAVEILNASLEMCPKRKSQTPQQQIENPHTTISACGISFGLNKLQTNKTEEVEKHSNSKNCVTENVTNLCPSSSMPNIDMEVTSAGKENVWGNTTHQEESNLPELASVEEENSSTDNLNDTFQVLKPALPNTPCIDTSRSGLFGNTGNTDASTPQLHNSSHVKNTPSFTRIRPNSAERSFMPQRLDFATDGKYEGVAKHNVLSRYQPRTSSTSYSSTAWMSGTRGSDREEKQSSNRRPSLDAGQKQTTAKLKTPLTQTLGKATGSSPLASSRYLPFSSGNAKSVPATSPHILNSSGNNALKGSSQDNSSSQPRQRPTSAFCFNTNNVNSLGTCQTSPKTYADAVKSPIVSKVMNCMMLKSFSSPVINNCVDEPMEGVMKTPDFSNNPDMQNIISTLQKKPSNIETSSIFKSAGDNAGETRQPLRVLNQNIPILKSAPPKISNSSTVQRSSSESSDGSMEVQKSQLKMRSTITSKRKQNRALAADPYRISQHRKLRLHASTKEPDVESAKLDHNEVTSKPSYMQPTFARAQKMLGLGREKPVQREGNNLSRRTITNQQPFILAWNRLTNNTDTSWKL